MKLKMEAQGDVTILVVTEDVPAQQAAVLKAGLKKLFESGKKSILMDLTSVGQHDAAALKDVAGLAFLPAEIDGRLVVVGTQEGLAHAPNRAEGLKLFESKLAHLLATEARLQARIAVLTQQKEAATAKMQSSGSGEDDIKTLRKENSDTKAQIRLLEHQVNDALKARKAPALTESDQQKLNLVEQTLIAVLKQQGVLT